MRVAAAIELAPHGLRVWCWVRPHPRQDVARVKSGLGVELGAFKEVHQWMIMPTLEF